MFSITKHMGSTFSTMEHVIKENSTPIMNLMGVECCITRMENCVTLVVGRVTHFMDSVCFTTRNLVIQIKTQTTTTLTSVIKTTGNTTKENLMKIRNRGSAHCSW
jgi:aspartate ammonia-lyase